MAAMLLFSDTVTQNYKDTAKAISEVELNKRLVIKKSLVDIMRQSFFQGASRYGTNFIA